MVCADGFVRWGSELAALFWDGLGAGSVLVSIAAGVGGLLAVYERCV